jgi:hypothetical protein
MSEYFTVGWWVIYVVWAIVVGGLWFDGGRPDKWSLGQWCMFVLIIGPVAWAVAAVCGVAIGLCLLWEFLGEIGKS